MDLITASDTERRGLADEDQLAYATSVSRAVYTGNYVDFARLHQTWLREGRHHAGIIVLRRQATDIGTQVRALVRLAATLDAATMRDRLEFLVNWMDPEVP